MRWLILPALLGPMMAAEATVEAPGPTPPLTGWSSKGRIGIFTSSVATSNANTSLDPEISASQDNTSFIGSLETTLWWRGIQGDEIEQHLNSRYGRSRAGEGDWNETSNAFAYDGVYRHRYHPRRAFYASGIAESAIVGPLPYRDAFDPLRTAIASGHSWIADNILPISDRLEARTGVRAQKRWGRSLDAYRREAEYGPEAWLRYERQQTPELSYWAGGEIFDEFADVEHFQTLVTAALHLQITRLLAVDVRLRMAYESAPGDIPPGANAVNYDRLGIREETLIGLDYSW